MRRCEDGNHECLATLYCERCVQNYLMAKFSCWTSGNDDIDELIQKCQEKIFALDKIIKWIPYNNLQNIEYLTKGGISEIYTANWIDGCYHKWDPEEKQLKRLGTHKVILKKLKNVENANRSWFDKVRNQIIDIHFFIMWPTRSYIKSLI